MDVPWREIAPATVFLLPTSACRVSAYIEVVIPENSTAHIDKETGSMVSSVKKSRTAQKAQATETLPPSVLVSPTGSDWASETFFSRRRLARTFRDSDVPPFAKFRYNFSSVLDPGIDHD